MYLPSVAVKIVLLDCQSRECWHKSGRECHHIVRRAYCMLELLMLRDLVTQPHVSHRSPVFFFFWLLKIQSGWTSWLSVRVEPNTVRKLHPTVLRLTTKAKATGHVAHIPSRWEIDQTYQAADTVDHRCENERSVCQGLVPSWSVYAEGARCADGWMTDTAVYSDVADRSHVIKELFVIFPFREVDIACACIEIFTKCVLLVRSGLFALLGVSTMP